ncbi:MAG: tetratricopeptide repeat protein [Burkholderiales bacterium]|nr:tetratricopeptide repeat protein [Burkholderiales bacterium]
MPVRRITPTDRRFVASMPALAIAVAMALAAPAAAQDPAPAPAPDSAPAAPGAQSGTPASPPSDLSADVFYRVILGNVAEQRGEIALAARAFFEAARDTRDPRLAARATDLASRAGLRGLAQESARLWAAADADDPRPREILAAYAAGRSRADGTMYDPELKTRLDKALAEAAATDAGVGELFMQMNAYLGDRLDKRQVYELVRDVAKGYPTSPEARYAVAIAAFSGAPEGQSNAIARDEIDRALALKPDWERAAMVKAELIGRKAPDEAIAFLEKFTATYPDARAAAAALGQLYVDHRRYAEGREVLKRLLARNPGALELQYGIAVISMQMKDWPTAEAILTELKRAKYADNGSIELFLAQVAEEEGRYDEAIKRYKAVPEGERNWLAQLRVAFIMGKMGKVGDARRYLSDLPAVTIEQRVQVRQAEAQLLRDANDFEGAYAVLEQANREHPDNVDLLYDTAMVAEKLGRIETAEAGLRKVVELKPDDPQALNGLGYTLVDRTSRITEGFALIERAHKLAPDDPFILDSMGWALFKLGRYDEAETYLRRALKERPDPEIAAHLGEVLWAAGQHDRAQEVWQSQLRTTPDNPVLLETVRRLAR